MSEPFDLDWIEKSRNRSLGDGIESFLGVYLWTLGPCYETNAEIRFFRSIGADVVGMSTVAEVIKAKEQGLSVLGISLVSNYATGLSMEELSHEEVLDSGKKQGRRLVKVISNCL